MQETQEEILEAFLAKYLRGEASADEIGELDKWYDTFDAKADLYSPHSVELHQAVAKGFSELKLKLGLK